MRYREELSKLLVASIAQKVAFERRARSIVEKQYSGAMQRAADTLMKLLLVATFDELLQAEKAFQENDLAVYAQRPGTLESVRESIDDFEAGEKTYRQLVDDTAAYRGHGYRKKEKVPPDYVLPLDAMRRALRGQVKRVENFRANVMGNLQEQAFLSARIALLGRAEELYDAMQRERLSPADQERT
jgi:hypothetical protein